MSSSRLKLKFTWMTEICRETKKGISMPLEAIYGLAGIVLIVGSAFLWSMFSSKTKTDSQKD